LTELPALTNERTQSEALDLLAQSYQVSGEPSRAIPFYRKSIAIDERGREDSHRQIALLNISNALGETGALRQAICDAWQALLLSRNMERAFEEGMGLHNLGELLNTIGNHSLGWVALNRSITIFTESGDTQYEGVAVAALAERALWVGDIANGNIEADRAWKLAAILRFERDFIRAAILQGQAARRQDNVKRADERLHHALTRARASNMVEFELPTLIALAELDLQRDRLHEARTLLEEVWEAAERGRYPLHLADAYNVLVAIANAQADKLAATDAATKAYKAAWCDGPPYAYHWGLQRAKAHLAALGAPEPAMPPFDESNFPPLPEVEINPKDEHWVDPDKLD